MSTIQCPRCRSAFPLAQVAQFDQFTCGACGTIVPVPVAPAAPAGPPPTVALSPQQIRAALKSAQAPAPAPIPQPKPAAAPSPQARPAAAQPAKPAAAPIPQARPAAPAPQAKAAPAPQARPGASTQPGLPPSAQRAAAQQAKPQPVAPAKAPVPARPAAAAPAPAPVRAARPAPVPEPVEVADDDAGDEDETPRRGRRGGRASREKKSPAAVYAGLAVAAVVVVGGIVLVMRKGDAPADGAPGTAPVAQQPVTDPETDAAAWIALPEGDRRTRAQFKLSQLDPKDETKAQALFNFFKARNEEASAKEVAEAVVKANDKAEWAHLALGHKDLRDEVDACIRDSQWSDGLGTDAMKELQTMRKKAPKSAPWFASDSDATRVRDLIAQIREEEKTLQTPFGQGVAKWANYHRSIEVMKDYPALHGTVGPYLVFISLPVPDDRAGKDVTLADVKAEDLERGKKLLEDTRNLYGAFYEAWHEQMGPVFGFQKYGPENADQSTTFLINVFTKEADYRRYNERVGGPGGGTRAYYSQREPRFVVTYDGPAESKISEELGEDTAQVQCHEGVHQLVHFYTWDLVRKSTGKSPEWLAINRKPLWFGEGFAEFFSAYRKEGDKYRFMQPLDGRMSDVWAIQQLLKIKGWEDWRLREVLEPENGGQMQIYGQSRARKNDEGLAINAMANLYYGKAWSLVYFLWNYEEGGKKKYHDRFVDYLKTIFNPQMVTSPEGRIYGKPTTPDAFRAAFGLAEKAKFDAFEKEWRDWEAKFLAEHKTAEWDRKKAVLWRIWNLNEDGTPKK